MRLDARGTIARIRDGGVPDADALRAFAAGLASGEVSDAQAGAFAMAVLTRGLGEAGRVALTEGMRDSGDVLHWDVGRPAVDKHSSGGIGDCTSLILAPALVACGVAVPMISGRGLGHTGGTLDKLESIPGFDVQADEARFRALVDEAGCAIVAASKRLAPADRRLYAIRDVTATVESIDLITASILSKKLAAGLHALILDVKCGSGAFMKTQDDAVALARSLVTTANGAGCRTAALVTDMDQPLCPAIGNAVEVALCLRVMDEGRAAAPKLYDLTVALCDAVLDLVGLPPKSAEAIDSGAAREHWDRMCAAQGGPAHLTVADLPTAPVTVPVPAPDAGSVAAIDGEALGLAVVHLGGGRMREGDRVDPRVGLNDALMLGDRVERGDPLALVHAADDASAARAVAAVQAAYALGERADPPPLIVGAVP